MSDVHGELGYVAAPASEEPEKLTGSLVLPKTIESTLRAVAKGRTFSRRYDVLFRLDTLARAGFIARENPDAPWRVTDLAKQYFEVVAERRREWLRAKRGKDARK